MSDAEVWRQRRWEPVLCLLLPVEEEGTIPAEGGV